MTTDIESLLAVTQEDAALAHEIGKYLPDGTVNYGDLYEIAKIIARNRPAPPAQPLAELQGVEKRRHVMPGDPPDICDIALQWYLNFDFGYPHSTRESNIAVEGFKDGYRAALTAQPEPVAQPPAQPGREEAGATQLISPEYNLLPKDITIAAERQDWPKELDTSASMSMDFERRYDASPTLDVRPEAEEQVERVAKAIYDATHAGLSNCYAWDDAWEDHQEARRVRYYKEARAAIAALSTLPTEPASVREERLLRVLQQIERRTKHHPDDTSADDKRDKGIAHMLAHDALAAIDALSTEEPKP